MVYSRRSAGAAAQANSANTPAYSTMSTRNSAGATATPTYPTQQYTGTANAAANYQQSYNTSTYQQAQTYTTTPQKPVQAQPQAQVLNQVQQPAVTPKVEETMQVEGEEGDDKPKRKFPVGPRFKVDKKVRRAKRNDNMRRVIKPKNSVMCLHELIPGLQFNIQDSTDHLGQTKFAVSVVAMGKTYEGSGHSKLVAKQNACENALKGILIERMNKQAIKEAEAKEKGMEVDENGSGPRPFIDVEEPIPWINVASFALHKLFSEWQAQGTVIPIEGVTPPGALKPLIPVKAKPVTRPMPENPLHYNPVMLLHMVRPTIVFTDSQTNTQPGGPHEFTVSCEVEGKTYSGVGPKKKAARKNCAKAVLADMGVVYPAETE